MVNGATRRARCCAVGLLAALVLGAAALSRSAEYDEQYTLFLTGGAARPVWPEAVFPAGRVTALQAGHASLGAIAHDLRRTDVHPPLYFWAVAIWRRFAGDGLFTARLLSVGCSLGTLGMVALLARQAGVPPALAMLLTLGCYGFAYTGSVARGFALAHLLDAAGMACALAARRRPGYALAAGALLGAAACANYLAVFVGLVGLAAVGVEAETGARGRPTAAGSVAALAPVTAGTGPPGAASPTPAPRSVHGRSAWTMTRKGRCAIPDDVISCRASEADAPVAGPPRWRWPIRRRAVVDAAKGERSRWRTSHLASTWRRLVPVAWALLGFTPFVALDVWFFVAQRASRSGQFPTFHLTDSLVRLARYAAANLFGGLPLYVPAATQPVVAAALAGLFLTACGLIGWRWRRIGRPAVRRPLTAAAMAPAVGLLALGLAFNNTPIELRYLSFATPYLALLLAGALATLPRRVPALLVAVQALALAGLILRPETMQPARTAAASAGALVGDGVVVVPRGNDGVGIVGAFAREAPDWLPLLVVGPDESADRIGARIAAERRVVLAPLAQDDASRSAIPRMQRAVSGPCWRRAAERSNVAAYDRICPDG